MSRLTGTVTAGGRAAEGAYVQLRSPADDFVGEVRSGPDGGFVLYPVPGRWRVVCWLAGGGRREEELEVGTGDAHVDVDLGASEAAQPAG